MSGECSLKLERVNDKEASLAFNSMLAPKLAVEDLQLLLMVEAKTLFYKSDEAT